MIAFAVQRHQFFGRNTVSVLVVLPITLPGITILHFGGDRCIERFSQADMLGVLIQIGAVPAPA